jgi:hypothetical protein
MSIAAVEQERVCYYFEEKVRWRLVSDKAG